MKKSTLSLFLLGLSISLSAQEVVTTQGDSYSNSSGSISFTLGETVINTGTDGVNEITQGFNQTKWVFVSLEDHALDYGVSVFPNPTQDQLNIKTENSLNVSYTLYDSKGSLIYEDRLNTKLTTLEVSHLAAGNYSLVLYNKKQILKTYKLIKNN